MPLRWRFFHAYSGRLLPREEARRLFFDELLRLKVFFIFCPPSVLMLKLSRRLFPVTLTGVQSNISWFVAQNQREGGRVPEVLIM